MAEFDPDAYLAKQEEFDPDAYLAKERPGRTPSVMEHRPPPAGLPGAKPGMSTSEAALHGFGQGASFGFADELAGALATGAKFAAPGLEYLPQAFNEKLTPQEMAYRLYGTQEIPYRTVRDATRSDTKQAQADQPGAYLGGALAGGLVTPGPKGLGAARLAKQGALLGAASGAGMSDADLLRGDVGGALVDTAVGGATGGVMTPVASGLTARLGGWLRKASQANALKAVGARAGISDVLGSAGVNTVDDARALGQRAIDMGLVRPFSTVADVAEGVGFEAEKHGARIGAVLSDADAAVDAERLRLLQEFADEFAREGGRAGASGGAIRPKGFDFDAAAESARKEIAGPRGLTAEAASKAGPANELVERMLEQGELDSSFQAANRLKSDIYRGLNYRPESALQEELQQRAVRGLKTSIEQQVEGRLGAEAADELRAANRDWGDVERIRQLASVGARRQMAHAGPLSFTPIAASVATGSPVPIAAKAAGPFIPSTLSFVQRNAARAALPAVESAMRATRTTLTEREQAAIERFLAESP